MPIDLNVFRLRNILPPSLKQDPEQTVVDPYAMEQAPETNTPIYPSRPSTLPPPLLQSTPVFNKPEEAAKSPAKPTESVTGDAPYRQRLMDLLSNPPLPENYKPSKLRRILGGVAAGMTGAAYGPERGSKIAEQIVDAPYQGALENWRAQVGPLYSAETLAQEREKLGIANLAAQANASRDLAAVDPTIQGQIEGSKEAAKGRAQEPYKVAESARIEGRESRLQTQKDVSNMERVNVEQKGQNLRLRATQAGEDWRTSKRLISDEKIANMNDATRRYLGKLSADTAKEIAAERAKSTKASRVPIGDQTKARIDAESQVLRESGQEELDNIAVPIKDKSDQTIGYTLKPNMADVPPAYQEIWKRKKAKAKDLADSMTGETFVPDTSQRDVDLSLGPWQNITGEK